MHTYYSKPFDLLPTHIYVFNNLAAAWNYIFLPGCFINIVRHPTFQRGVWCVQLRLDFCYYVIDSGNCRIPSLTLEGT